MPIVNLDAVAPQALDVQKGGRAWKLRMDVPSSRLVRCFYLLEMEREQPKLEALPDPTTAAAGQIDFAAVRSLEAELRAHEERFDAETLSILGDIWRWSYPDATDEDLRAWLTPAERRELVQLFFLGLLARSQKLPRAVTGGSSPTDSPSPSTTTSESAAAVAPAVAPTAPAQTVHPASSPTSREPASTRSATRLPAASSRSPRGAGRSHKAKRAAQTAQTAQAATQPVQTVTASGVAASIY